MIFVVFRSRADLCLVLSFVFLFPFSFRLVILLLVLSFQSVKLRCCFRSLWFLDINWWYAFLSLVWMTFAPAFSIFTVIVGWRSVLSFSLFLSFSPLRREMDQVTWLCKRCFHSFLELHWSLLSMFRFLIIWLFDNNRHSIPRSFSLSSYSYSEQLNVRRDRFR